MSDGTGIAWTDATWSPILGCSPASSGCAGCYAIRDVWRMAHNPNPKIAGPRAGLVEKTSAGVLRWTGKVSLLSEQLEVPLHWRKPRRIFVANQSDLFHEGVPTEFVHEVFKVMTSCPHHTFQVLTKRAARMRDFLQWWASRYQVLPNVWVGVSVEDQAAADERIPELMMAPTALRFLSCEPLLGPLRLWKLTRGWREPGRQPEREVYPLQGLMAIPDCDWDVGRIGWVIVGGESGQRARGCDVAWARTVVEQCLEATVPVFVKQLGTQWAREQNGLPDPKGADPEEWPEDLRVRQMPEVSGG